MGKLVGKDIREVWDWRLSVGSPILYNNGPTWVVRIFANDGSGILEEHDTGIPAVNEDGKRDPHDTAAVAECFKWLKSVRDNYSREHIDLRKPVVAMINAANRRAAEINQQRLIAISKGDADESLRLHGELQGHLDEANALIKRATAQLNSKIMEAAS